ncbi:MAG TPA: BtrH N-terminal domain-containing protein [Clostridia bacterium]|nr:BtrH N-terminal domain-containing protein [Clostridia bacterium]
METDLQHFIPVSYAKIGKNCILTSINCITEHSGCGLSETDLFILSNGFNIKYSYDLCSIGKLSTDVFSDIEKETSIRVNIRRKDYEGIFPGEMDYILATGNLILLLVDTAHLRYSSLYSENANRQHAILLNGISLDEERAHIVDLHLTDYSGNTSIYQGEVPLEEVMAAAYAYVWLDLERWKDFSEMEIWRIARRGFDDFMKGFSGEEFASGLSAVINFVSDINKLELLDDQALAATCKDINYNIKVKSINCINKFIISFINESSVSRELNCTKLIDSIGWHISEWEKIGLSILRIGISKRKGGLSGIREKGIALLDSQREVYNEFSNYLRGLTA